MFWSNPGYKDNSDSYYSNLLEVLEDKKDVIKYCPITFILLEDNSRYCLICQKYIKGFNHHCYWIGNCIGENNFNKFMFFLCLCIVNIGYNLLLIILYFIPEFLIKFFIFKKNNEENENDFDVDNYIQENQKRDGDFILFRFFRGFLAVLGLYICLVFLTQLIELFDYHYKRMKEKEKNKNKI